MHPSNTGHTYRELPISLYCLPEPSYTSNLNVFIALSHSHLFSNHLSLLVPAFVVDKICATATESSTNIMVRMEYMSSHSRNLHEREA